MARVLHTVESLAPSSYVVGGFVRDSLLGLKSRDIDIVIPGDPFETARQVAKTLRGSYVPLDQEHGIARVVLPFGMESGTLTPDAGGDTLVVDMARYEGRIEDDLARRDFTVDAIAVPVGAIALQLTADGLCPAATIVTSAIDPLGGLADLSNRILRHSGTEVFQEDPGRLLRAVRLAREFSLTVDPTTESLLIRDAHLIANVAAERTREELIKLLELPQSADSIRYMDRIGMLTAILPELELCRDVEQPTCHFWDVLEHSIQTVATFEFITGQADWRYGNDEMLDNVPAEPEFRAYLSREVSSTASRTALIKLGCLLHDISKPQTRELDESGRARFLGHAKDGAAVAKAILQRLRFSSQETAYVETLVYNHLRPAQMSTEAYPTSRAVYRFFRDTADAGAGVLYVAMADYLACRGPLFTMTEWCNVCTQIAYILHEHRRQEVATSPPKLIDGRDLMRTLELKPSPVVGTLLEAIREAQASGLVATREDALQLARNTIEKERLNVRTSK